MSRDVSETKLEAIDLTAGYGDLAAVRGVNFSLKSGEIVALLGPNGAGKSTLLMTLAGVLRPLAGRVMWLGTKDQVPLHQRVRHGLGLVPEKRSVLMDMSVKDNLRLGGGDVDGALDLFPELGTLLKRKAGLLSGGEQQILTLARALARGPQVLLVDELSLGLAPIVVDRLLAVLAEASASNNVAILLVEQQTRRALRVADRWCLLRQGELVAEGSASEDTEALEATYMAGSLAS